MPTTLIPLTKGCTLGRIDHNMPRVMTNPMDKNKWMKFCDGVDAILMPTKLMIWFRLLVFVSSVVLLGLSISKLQPLQHKNVSHWKHTSTYDNSGFIWLIIAAGILLVLVIIISFVIRCLTSTAVKKLEDLCDRNSGKGVDFYLKDKYHIHRIRKQISKLCVEVSTTTTVVSVDTGSNDSDIEEVLEVVEGQYDDSYDIEEVEVLEEEQEEEEQSDDSYGSYDDESPEPSQSNNPTSTTTSISPLPHPTQSPVVLAAAYAVKENDTFNNQVASPSVTTFNVRKWDRREQQKLAQSKTKMSDVDVVGDFVSDIVVEPIIVNRNWDIREQRKLTESRIINDDNKYDMVQDLTIGKVDIIGDVVINIDNESVLSAMP